jgi:GNAT superfamily N-acetyltransferase
MTLPAGVRLHRPEGTDEDAVAALVLTTACQVADTGRSDRELADVIEDWQRPGVALDRDTWLADDSAGETVGYAFVMPPFAEIRVHPRTRGLGLGSHLRELVEARALELGAIELRQLIPAGNRPAERPLELAGYAPVRRTWRLERPLDVAPEPPAWPPGITHGGPEDDRDIAEVLALLERSEADEPDGTPLALDRFHAEHLSEQRLDRDLSVLAYARDQLIGAAICETWNDADGIVVQLAVDHPGGTVDVGRALLLAAFAQMRERGLETVVVQVGARGPDVPQPYAGVGLRPAWQQIVWRKPLG